MWYFCFTLELELGSNAAMVPPNPDPDPKPDSDPCLIALQGPRRTEADIAYVAELLKQASGAKQKVVFELMYPGAGGAARRNRDEPSTSSGATSKASTSGQGLASQRIGDLSKLNRETGVCGAGSANGPSGTKLPVLEGTDTGHAGQPVDGASAMALLQPAGGVGVVVEGGLLGIALHAPLDQV